MLRCPDFLFLLAYMKRYVGYTYLYMYIYICTSLLMYVCVHIQACRNLRKCLNMQPHCVPALVAMAHVELSRNNTAAADRCLEQSLSGDFSIRSCTLFRLLTCQVYNRYHYHLYRLSSLLLSSLLSLLSLLCVCMNDP